MEATNVPSPDSERIPDTHADKTKKYDSSLLKALHTTFFWSWWISGLLKFLSGLSRLLSSCHTFESDFLHLRLDTFKTTTPLVNKVLLTWLTNSYTFYRASESERSLLGISKPQGIGFGIGLAFALFAMQGIVLVQPKDTRY